MDWEKKNVCVTGAGGFIASYLLEELVSLKAKVRAFVRYNSRNDFGMIETLPLKIKNGIKIISGNLLDPEAVSDAVKGVDIVFHLGALISIPYSYVHPREAIETNIMGTYNVLSAGLRWGVKKIVHTSTSEVYGSAREVPIPEEHPLQAQSPYSASKIGADKIAESFYNAYNLPITTIRPFNAYGPRQSARAIIPTIISQALKNDTVYLGSLAPKRDLTYVKDTASAFIKIAESEKTLGKVINIGSGFEISMKDLVQKISQLLGRKLKITCQDCRVRPKNSEVDRLWADNRKAKYLLGWFPSVPLEEGLKITIDWIKKNQHLYKEGIYNL
jgi:NAD dependent epimerase/dehydratase